MIKIKLPGKIQKPTLVLFVLLFGIGGALLIKISSASVPNPDGYADYCYLEGNNTVIYGWAHDDDAPAGDAPYVIVRLSTGQSATVPTNIGGYRDAEISQDMAAKGHTTSSIYGFKAVFSGVYKGSAPGISGTIVNYGAGADSNLGINYFRIVDGNPNNFPDQKVPDACLPSAPVPVIPQPTPTPQPSPQPLTRTTTPRPVTKPTPASPAALTSDADAAPTIGSLVTSLLIPNGNAEKIQVIYGLAADKLDMSSDQIAVTPDTTSVLLSKLKPDSTYYYQLIRLKNDNTSAASPVASLKTLGLDVVLTFRDGDQAVVGIEPSIDDVAASDKSDEKGVLTIKQVAEGEHTVSFSNNGKDFKRKITISAANVQSEALNNPVAGVVASTIQLHEDAKPVSTPKKKASPLPWIILMALLIGVIGGGGFWLVKRRRAGSTIDDESFLPAAFSDIPPPVASVAPPPPATHPAPPAPIPYPPLAANPDNQPPAPRIGESLPDLVIRSIRAEAARKKAVADKKDQQ